MICWWCRRPIIIPVIVKNIKADTVKINDSVRMTEQTVNCSTCGADFRVEISIEKRPTISDGLLAHLEKHSKVYL